MLDTLEAKQCRKCLAVKPLDEFSRCPTGVLGKQSYCKSCCAKQGKYVHHQRIERAYGVSATLYHLMLEAQHECCALCRKHQSENSGFRLSVDHCHKTGNVRGLLCNNCNRAVGLLQDDPDLIAKAAIYVREGFNYASDQEG